MLAKKKKFGGNTFYYCAKCKNQISSKYDAEFTNIEYFGPPIIICNNCGEPNETNLLPYSKLSWIKKFLFWSKILIIPTIIWFFAGPLFVIVLIWHVFLNLGNTPPLEIFFITLVTVPFGTWFIFKKNQKFIKKTEEEHISNIHDN